MKNTIVVTYELKKDFKDTHISLLNAVFEELKKLSTENVDYKVLCSSDGVTFTHISTFKSNDGSNPLVELMAFKNFNKNLSDRILSPPKVESVTLIGNYF
ncbi:MAG: hypothetical protein WCI60_02775 [bacterium]|jgi:hypothetical protein